MASSDAPRRLYPALILTVAAVLRLAVVLAATRGASVAWFFSTGAELGNLAESLRTGHGFSSPFGGATGPTAFLAPGYPAFVAAIFAVFGPYTHASALLIMLLQALFGVATVFMLMSLARPVFGDTAANLAGLIWALCPFAWFIPTLFWESSLSILLATSILALALAARGRHTLTRWLLMGLVAALTLAINPSLLPILAGYYGWAIYQARHQSLRAPASGFLLCLLLSAPWAIRNAAQLHAFIPLRTNAGYELWQGNRPGADGFFEVPLHPTVNRDQFNRYASLGELAYMREKSAQAKAAIAADPAHFATLTARRALWFWTGRARVPRKLEMAYIITITTFGLVGLALLWFRDRALTIYFLLPLLLFPLPYYITHPDVRFRMILDPMLVALAAYALTGKARNKSKSL